MAQKAVRFMMSGRPSAETGLSGRAICEVPTIGTPRQKHAPELIKAGFIVSRKLKKSKNKNNNQSPSDSAGSSIALNICKQVSQIYDWLDSNIKSMDVDCSACGKCCDFESFGHKF